MRSHAPRPPTVTPTVTPTVRFTPHVYMYICTPQVAYEGNQDARKLIRAEEVPPPPAQSIGWGGLVRFVRTTVRFVRTNGGQVRVLCGTRNPWSRSRPPPPAPRGAVRPARAGRAALRRPRHQLRARSLRLQRAKPPRPRTNRTSPPSAPVRTGRASPPAPSRPRALTPRGARRCSRALRGTRWSSTRATASSTCLKSCARISMKSVRLSASTKSH